VVRDGRSSCESISAKPANTEKLRVGALSEGGFGWVAHLFWGKRNESNRLDAEPQATAARSADAGRERVLPRSRPVPGLEPNSPS
jgi:hypothetical protein